MIASLSEQSELQVPSAVSAVLVTVNVEACATDADPTTMRALITNSMVESATFERTLEPRFTFLPPRGLRPLQTGRDTRSIDDVGHGVGERRRPELSPHVP